MKVGWLADDPGYVGGAELTQAEFRRAAPEGVEIIDCPPGAVLGGLDAYVIHNHTTYSLADIPVGRCIRYHHDLRLQLDFDATHIFCSPLQRAEKNMKGEVIPPPLSLIRYRDAAESASQRAGAVCVGSWVNPAKAPERVAEWAADNGGVTFYGSGPFAPPGSIAVPYEQMPEVLARYKTFVFLPTVIEPFGRAVVEAWAAGCEIVTNALVGARHFIENDPAALDTAAADFWAVVCRG